MPSEHSICIGCHWKERMYALLTAPEEDIYFINPSKSKNNRFNYDNMEILLTRHEQTKWNALRKVQGRSDIELNEKGIEQANNTKKFYKMKT